MLRATKKCAKVLKSESSFIYLAMSILSEAGYPYISALCAAVGPANLFRLVTLFSGASFKIPTGKEMSSSILTALYLYHKYVEPMPFADFLKAYEIDVNMKLAIKTRAKQWEKAMSEKGINVKELLNRAVDF